MTAPCASRPLRTHASLAPAVLLAATLVACNRSKGKEPSPTPVPTSFTLTWSRGATPCELVDVFFLFDDTGSFAGTGPVVQTVFANLVADLQVAFPQIDFAFGVGRFEDYGGPGQSFSGEDLDGRPFTLNQPMLATSAPNFSASLASALARNAPGFGGDGPESDLEALYQVATGDGLDGDGSASKLDSGPAGALATQINPGNSGDVPPFASNVAASSGSLGGAGFREGSCRLVLLATDVCSVVAFDALAPIPVLITGTGGSVAVEQFACTDLVPGTDRFGLLSDSISAFGNTVSGAVAPSSGHTLPQTIAALNALGVQVIGLTNRSSAPPDLPVPLVTGAEPTGIAMLQGLAILTGATDDLGTPLVFAIDPSNTTGLETAISSALVADNDVELVATDLQNNCSVTSVLPPVVASVGDGESATFEVVTLRCANTAAVYEFRDVNSGTVLATAVVDFSGVQSVVLVEGTSDDVVLLQD
jgi:hypothetical protein